MPDNNAHGMPRFDILTVEDSNIDTLSVVVNYKN